MKSKLDLYYFLVINTPFINDKDPAMHLINKIEEIEKIYEKYPYESKKLFYFAKNDIHNLFYNSDYIFEFYTKNLEENSDKIKLSELFYLQLLISDRPEIINYTYKSNYIFSINRIFNNTNENNLQNIIVSKIIIDLINNILEQEEVRDIQQLEKIREDNKALIQKIITKNDILIKLKYSLNDVLEKKIDEIYTDIIILLIKLNMFIDNFDDTKQIIEELNLETIIITQRMFEEIKKSLDESNDYMENYKIEDIYDLEKKINFYYIMRKYILKDFFCVYNIPFLKNNYLNIIKMRYNYRINHVINLDDNIRYIFDIDKDINKLHEDIVNYNNKRERKFLDMSFIKEDNDINKNIYINSISAEIILQKVNIILKSQDKQKKNLAYEIKDISFEDENINLNILGYILNYLNKKTSTYKNSQHLLNFLIEIEDYISINDLKFKPDIKLELKKEDNANNYYYYDEEMENNKDPEIYNISCISSFEVNTIENEKKEYTFIDYNILVNGIDKEPKGFQYLINELTNNDYENTC